MTTTGAGVEPAAQRVSTIALFGTRLVKAVAILAAIFTIYTEGATAFLNTQEALRVKSVTDNAAVRQKSEAEIAEQQARTQLEVARNSAERLKAEADKAEADALKAEADAVTAGQGARNAGLKARSEAASLSYEAQIRRSKAISELEAARVAARQFKAQADLLEQKNLLKAKTLADAVHDWGLTRCPGSSNFDKVHAKQEGRC
ncbi:MAG: hypothetical protein WAN43_18300 [Rhodomicrobium sp.]